MTQATKEKDFENHIENHLLQHGGYIKGEPTLYDSKNAIVPTEIIAFIEATQTKHWEKQKRTHKGKLQAKFMAALCKHMSRYGSLYVLRKGFDFYGSTFKLAYFRPASGMNDITQARYEANRLMVMRQVRYNPKKAAESIDTVLFLNGIPIATIELKNLFTGQTYKHAEHQYRNDRDPKAPIFRFKERALVHFAVDNDIVSMTTHVKGSKTFFLPFNRGYNNGKGNPPVMGKNKTSYLWEKVLQRDSILDIIGRFIFVEKEEKTIIVKGKEKIKTDEKIIFPRYHQLAVVRNIIDNVLQKKAGTNYLVQHSAGSGKSNSIAWLAHRLSSLHDDSNSKIFDCVVVLTDRKVLDQQLQDTISQIDHKKGVVRNIENNTSTPKSTQLAEALKSGVPIIISTIHTYGFLHEKLAALPDRNYAIIVDEAHSSQSGEMSVNVKKALASSTALEAKMDIEEDDSEVDKLAQFAAAHRGQMKNLSFFAFTATPKYKTLRIFGVESAEGQHRPFHLYSMKQAIEEGFILDVLKNYVTYKVFIKMVKRVEDDPELDKKQAAKALGKFISLHPHNIAQKTEVIIEHFRECVASKIGGKAKAMVVTGSRLHAARYKLAFDKYIKEKGYNKIACLVAFSGELKDKELPGSFDKAYTEISMNNHTTTRMKLPPFKSEAELAERFNEEHFQLLLVANKYQTGFDQPLLHTMYVDKVLSGIQAVQTLSRLNRTCTGKEDTFVLDFVNDREVILKSFQDYYESAATAEDVDPQRLYELKTELMDDVDVLREAEINNFATVYFQEEDLKKADHGKLNGYIDPAVDRFVVNLDEDQQEEYRHKLTAYRNLYAFLSQVVPFTDKKLEKLYIYGKYLLKKLPKKGKKSIVDIEGDVSLQYYRIDKMAEGNLLLAAEGEAELYGPNDSGGGKQDEEKELLSALIELVNERFGTDFSEGDRYFFDGVIDQVSQSQEIEEAAMANHLDGFQIVLKKHLEDALLDRHGSNSEFIENCFSNEDLFSMLLSYAAKKLHKQFRDPQRPLPL